MKFLWVGKTTGRYIAPIKFSKLERPMNKGGLGILNLKQWNRAAFAKHIDTYYNGTDSLWAIWSKRNVTKGCSLCNMSKPQNMSWTWQSIFKIKETFLPLIQMNTFPIYCVSFWDDPWLDKGFILRRQLSYNEIRQSGIHSKMKVRDFLSNNNRIQSFSSNPRVQCIWNIIRRFTSLSTSTARIVWGDNKAKFSIGDGYEFLMKNGTIPRWNWWKRTWSLNGSFRDNLLLWKVLNRAVLSKTKLACMGMNVNIYCSFCCDHPETVEHLYFECSYIKQIWNVVMSKLKRDNVSQDNRVEWEIIHAKTGSNNKVKRLFTVVMKSFISAMCKERNNRVFEVSKVKSDVELKNWIIHEIKQTMGTQTYSIDPGIYASFLKY